MSYKKTSNAVILCNLGFNYWSICENVIEKLISTGNAHVIISDEEITEEVYAEETRWSDFNVSVPTLFNFYHGIELSLKGILATRVESIPKTHKLSSLFHSIQQYCQEAEILDFFTKYIHLTNPPALLAKFFNENNINPDQYYIALKYPFEDPGQDYSFLSFRYKGKTGIPLYCELRDDTQAVRKQLVAFFRASIRC